MSFDPNNPVIRLCVLGMDKEATNKAEAKKLFEQTWNEARTDLEKYLGAYYVARVQETTEERLAWTQKALDYALKINDSGTRSALPALYASLASCYEGLNDQDNAEKYKALSATASGKIDDPGPFYHGTRADLKVGDQLTPGFNSNYQTDLKMNHIYFTALVNGAGLAAALAGGEGKERVYRVEPTGQYENDPNVTDKKFPGNPSRSYRTGFPLRVVGEVQEWVRQTAEQIQTWKERLANSRGEIIN